MLEPRPGEFTGGKDDMLTEDMSKRHFNQNRYLTISEGLYHRAQYAAGIRYHHYRNYFARVRMAGERILMWNGFQIGLHYPKQIGLLLAEICWDVSLKT